MSAPGQHSSDRAAGGGPRGHILVVDDSSDIRALLSRGLTALDYRVTAVADGRAGVDAVAAGGIDLVLLDVQMPEMDGLTALAALRREHGPVELPVIMVT